MSSDESEKDSKKARRSSRGRSSEDPEKTKDLLDAAIRLSADSNAFIARAMAMKTLAKEVRRLQAYTSDLEGEIQRGDHHCNRAVEELQHTTARLNVLERERILHLRDCHREELAKKVEKLKTEKKQLEEKVEKLEKELKKEKSRGK